MLDGFTDFFIASTGASAAFIGLLFVALTVVNTEKLNKQTRARRNSLAGSSFAQLFDAFLVSIVGLLGGVRTFAAVNIIMAVAGLLITSRLLPQAVRAGNMARGYPTRRLNIALPAGSILIYALQIILSLILLGDPQNAGLVRALVYASLGLYAGALVRAWEITKA